MDIVGSVIRRSSSLIFPWIPFIPEKQQLCQTSLILVNKSLITFCGWCNLLLPELVVCCIFQWLEVDSILDLHSSLTVLLDAVVIVALHHNILEQQQQQQQHLDSGWSHSNLGLELEQLWSWLWLCHTHNNHQHHQRLLHQCCGCNSRQQELPVDCCSIHYYHSQVLSLVPEIAVFVVVAGNSLSRPIWSRRGRFVWFLVSASGC